MMRHPRLEHRFVQHIPDQVDPGVLYISMEFATAVHRCCCGCGEEVVTPFTPTDWRMTFDGETVSLDPSVGNWSFRCRSHYVVRRGQVIEAGAWSDDQVAAGRRRDKAAKARQFGTTRPGETQTPAAVPSEFGETSGGMLSKVRRWLSRRW